MNGARKIRVLVVEDSPVVQQLLAHVIGEDPRLELAGIAASGEQALRMVDSLRPDVVSLDIRLPGIDGFAVTQRLMRDHPVPIVVVASDVRDLDIPMRALQAGALAVVEKPGSMARADYQTVARHLCTQLTIMSQVKVIRQRGRPRNGDEEAPGNGGRGKGAAAAPPPPLPPSVVKRQFRALGIAASTGGPAALVKLLRGLPTNFPLPVFVVQHIGAPFVAGFASWLGSVTPLPVALASDGPHRPGHVYVAPGEHHLTAEPGGMRLVQGDPVCGQRPSGDVLFSSLASAFGAAAIGVLLTGMGEDGARGLTDMRRTGAYTIAEHASTAVIHSMPGTAVRLGGVTEELPIDKMAARLLELVSTGVEPS
ncbi:two-component system chemotaxis response regulator CheB [Azospirillum brasilense]|uniref:Protein-glutamate methylesterase/protein-glutamine glutaminase n=1 Tax=Azospirillum brasilense TaxID=192 RepID=A0A560ASL5_AZOBR|nr:chemotaxis protein CheB [Azospirillum brasilense]TWA63357.1 two-component system chemotaxis response regulator CheB [Azospirillum brasilense]